MKFRFIKKVEGEVSAYCIAGIKTGDVIEIPGHLLAKAELNPDFESVEPAPKPEPTPAPEPAPAPAPATKAAKKTKGKAVSEKAEEQELELPLEPVEGEDDGEQEANI